MQTEIEAKFIRIEHDDIRNKLLSLGAVKVNPSRLMKRKNFDYPDRRLEKEYTGWVRVRDEGDKITLAYKQLNDRTIHGTKEVSLEVSDFDITCRFLESIGMKAQSYQETKRESWKIGNVEIELDEWPWVPSFIEIEAPTEDSLKAVVKKLGLDISNAVHGSVEIVYQDVYDVTEEEVDHWESIVFSDVPDWLEAKRK